MLEFLRSVFLILQKLKRFEFYLIHIIKMEKRIMTTVAELESKVTTLIDHVTKESAQAAATLKGLGDEIAALKVQLQNGSPATQADLDHLSAMLDGVITAVDQIIPDAPVPVPAPAPEPTPPPVPPTA